MKPFGIFIRIFVLLNALPLVAQLYMSSFSEVKYDRVKNPAIFHGGARVDPITGAVSVDIPLGPGIGARGAEYVPTFRLRCSPQVFGNTFVINELPNLPMPGIGGLWYYPPRSTAPLWQGGGSSIHRAPDTLKGFVGGLNPGTIQINVHPGDDLLKTFAYDLPNGESGTTLGALPPGIDVARLLADFGYGDYSVSKEPGATATNRPGGSAYLAHQRVKDLVRATTGGGVLIGLKGGGLFTDVNWRQVFVGYGPSTNPTQPLQNPLFDDLSFPAMMLLIKGDVAYEFVLGSGYASDLIFDADKNNETIQTLVKHVPSHAVYLVRRILNRVGDELRFEPFAIPDPNPTQLPFVTEWSLRGGPGVVTWYRNGVSMGVSIKGTTSNSESLFNETFFKAGPASPPAVHRLDYQGINHSAYTITSGNWVDGPFSSNSNRDIYAEMQQGAFTTVTQEESGETVRLLGASGQVIPGASTYGNNVVAQVLSEIQFPTHTLKFDWDFYQNVRGNTTTEWCGHGRSPYLYWVYGITKVTDRDPIAPGQPRITQYRRIVPKLPYRSEFRNLIWDDRMDWTERRQLAAVTHPDGSTTLFKYFEPPALGVNDGPGAPNDIQILGMAALKHVLKEERHYKPGAFDFNNIDGSTPYLTVDHGALSLRHLCNPDGVAVNGNMPYAGSTVTRDLDTGVVNTESLENWDTTHFGWKTQLKTIIGGGKTFDRSLQRTYEFVPTHWMGPRVTWEQVAGRAAIKRTYDDKNRVTTESYNDKGPGNMAQDAALNLTYAYSTPTQAQPDQTLLTSTPPLSLSGAVGAAYTYDTFGYIKTIRPFGSAGYFEQVNDAFGRPTAQYDQNRQRTDIQWRTDGRLGSIAPPGEVSITYTYDADARGLMIQRGIGPKSQLRYNGFGELVLERRWNGSGIPSHRLSSFDTMGRKRWDSLWDSSAGNEISWTLTVPPLEVPPPSDRGRCLRWGIGLSGIAECDEWEVVANPPNLLIAGPHYQYDHRGRLTQTLAPGGTGSTLTYTGLQKTVTNGLFWRNFTLVDRGSSTTTQFDNDALGRLVSVTDALNQITTYAYDDADRITQVMQQDPIDLTRTQMRAWSYNTLGWPLSLTQPESGTTSYSSFDVSGKPWTTSYNGRVVNSTFDTQGRILTLKSLAPDISVNQAFTWDTAALNGKGKLHQAAANGVIRELDYGGVGGRLSTLTRNVDGLPFQQRFAYDTYGNLISRTYSDGTVQTITPDLAMGLPVASVFNGIQVMPIADYDPIHWGLRQMYLANGATNSFSYHADQSRLTSQRHQVTGKLDQMWTYTYDDMGRLVSDSQDWYNYDKLNRLISAFTRDPFDTAVGNENRGLLQIFSYDAFGNRMGLDSKLVKNWTAGTAPPLPTSAVTDMTLKAQTYTFGAGNVAFTKNQLPADTTAGATTGALYDAQGNLTQIYKDIGDTTKSVTLTYDALGRVKTMADASRNVIEVYTYDDQGLRVIVELYQGSVAPQNLQKKQYRIYNEARQLVSSYELVLE